MSSPFLAEVKLFGGNFAPVGFALCNGQLLAISSNTALFSLIGTYYGGNGTSNFALPNFQGISPMSQGQGPGLSPRSVGEDGGEENHVLVSGEMPLHTHNFIAGEPTAGGPGTNAPIQNVTLLGDAAPTKIYEPFTAAPVAMAPNMIATSGANQGHVNQQPYLTVTFIIALQGIYPARN